MARRPFDGFASDILTSARFCCLDLPIPSGSQKLSGWGPELSFASRSRARRWRWPSAPSSTMRAIRIGRRATIVPSDFADALVVMLGNGGWHGADLSTDL